MNLNDRATVTALDPKGMFTLTEAFSDQCRKALAIGQAGALKPLAGEPNLVVLTGLGGSASGGDFARALFEAGAKVPYAVNRDYHLPAYVSDKSIVFCSSYSGNTEETLSAYEDAQRVGARIICVTSGGKLAEWATRDGHDLFIVPGGQPPRTALGFMLVPVLVAAVRLGLIPDPDFAEAFAILDETRAVYGLKAPDNAAQALARELHGSLGIIYGLGPWQSLVAYRWKCQINENAKNHIFVHSFPELNHNEILGWVKADEQNVAKYVTIVLEDGTESAKMKTRAAVTERLVGSFSKFHYVRPLGTGLFAKMLSLTYIGDFVSLYLAVLNQVDPENIDSINILKTELSKIA
ncbi:MAG: bifunctional phosphoglucose/phosphomannose isomerase [Fimbriimonas sp.]